MAKAATKTKAVSAIPSVPDPEQLKILAGMGEPVEAPAANPDVIQPLYQIFEGSRKPVSKAFGKGWKAKIDAAIHANTWVHEAWEEAYRYFNHNQVKDNNNPRGHFKRGDNTENIVFANINTVLPATYSRNPDITCTAISGEAEPFCKTLQALINTLIRRPQAPGINLKSKAKRQAMFAELTNLGAIKLDYKAKDESRDLALQEMDKLMDEIAEAKTIEEVNAIGGKLMALEEQVETREPSGFNATNPLPHNMVIDPYAEQEDGMDANWIAEITFLPTDYLNQRFAKKDEESTDETARVLIYKPTHKAVFNAKESASENDLGPVLVRLDQDGTFPVSHTDDERLSYLYTYMTEVVYVWDKVSRRISLFAMDDWTWPIWVWDDYLHLSRFFPYFILQYVLSTGGTVSPGAVSYYLDQQDTINDINREIAKLRRRAFDYFFFNSQNVDKAEVEKMMRAMNAKTRGKPFALGVKLEPGMKFDDVFGPIGMPNKDMAPFFDKSDTYAAIDRQAATSDALRGVQFKANTTEDAVQAYTDATRLRIGAKIDASEDCLAALARSMAEICVQKFTVEDVAALIGQTLAKDWKPMSVEEFNATYNVEIVAGSIEKPTSIYKKKEAVEVAQAIGQFGKVSPVALIIALRVLERAFTEVVIKPEEWDMLEQSIVQALQAQQQPAGGAGGGLEQELAGLPPEVKERALKMRDQGVPPAEILAFMREQAGTTSPPAQGAKPNGQAQQPTE